MNTSVVLFFLGNVLATLILGCKFVSQKDRVFRNFGIALILDAVAFAIWSLAVIMNVQNLEQYVTFGSIFLIASFVFYLVAGTQHMSPKNRQSLIFLGVVIGLVILYLRAFVYPSAPGFSPEGFFFFNPHPVIQMLYIFGLMLAAFPAIDAVSAKFKTPSYHALVRYGFIAEVAGSIVLLTSNIANPNMVALNVTGWIIAVVFFVLWVTLVFNKKAWS